MKRNTWMSEDESIGRVTGREGGLAPAFIQKELRLKARTVL